MTPLYVETVNLLIDIAPVVFNTTRLAMKGGTALNLFVQDLPRLSVDIDVAYCDHDSDRDTALVNISEELNRIEFELAKLGYNTDIKKTRTGDEVKLFVFKNNVQVKVEINYVFRGIVLPIQHQPLTKKTQEFFSKNINVALLSPSELYGSKLVATLARQHPRDIFDVKKMYESHSLTSEILDCFVVYLAGHNRPVHEVLFPKIQPIQQTFINEFSGMTSEPISAEELERTRAKLILDLPRQLTSRHKQFLISLVQADPKWDLIPYEHVKKLPALKWKLHNLKTLSSRNKKLFEFQSTELIRRLDDL